MVRVYQIADYIGESVRKLAKNLHAQVIVTDAQLLERAKDNDNTAFGELVKRHQNFVFKTAYGYLADSELARDITQDVFVKAYRGLPYFQNDSQFSTWLYKICKNHCLNMIRHRKLEADNEQYGSNDVNNPDLSLKLRMRSLLSKLTNDHREILILRYYDNLKYEEIAHYLGVSLSVVKVRLFRARQELKQLAVG